MINMVIASEAHPWKGTLPNTCQRGIVYENFASVFLLKVNVEDGYQWLFYTIDLKIPV